VNKEPDDPALGPLDDASDPPWLVDLPDVVRCRTSYSNATPSGSFPETTFPGIFIRKDLQVILVSNLLAGVDVIQTVIPGSPPGLNADECQPVPLQSGHIMPGGTMSPANFDQSWLAWKGARRAEARIGLTLARAQKTTWAMWWPAWRTSGSIGNTVTVVELHFDSMGRCRAHLTSAFRPM
jgi:hypothetical protein